MDYSKPDSKKPIGFAHTHSKSLSDISAFTLSSPYTAVSIDAKKKSPSRTPNSTKKSRNSPKYGWSPSSSGRVVFKAKNSSLYVEDKENVPPNTQKKISPIRKNRRETFTSGGIKKNGSLSGSLHAVLKKKVPDVRTLFNHKSKAFECNIGLTLVKSSQVFGIPLENLMKNQEVAFPDLLIPYFVHSAIQLLLNNGGINEHGIFRISANHSLVEKFKVAINSGKELEYSSLGCDLHVTACLLKTFFRDLPGSLFPLQTSIEIINLISNYSFCFWLILTYFLKRKS